MDSKEKVLTLASAARKVGLDPDELKQLIYDGKLDAVETEGGNLLIGEESLKGIIKEIQSTELSHQEVSNIIPDDIKMLLSQAATFIERQEEELKVYRDREEKHISLLKGAEKQISKTLDQLNVLYLHNLNLNKENRKILQKLITIQSKDNI
ncbi:MAG: hypothetical protein VYB67_05605 [Pseudomonadota bacterium]|nr:hypothetical protein [Pseudomonadota bacterium]MEC9459418.1 hypothetical protein [Pseudomonadota bacterium]